MIKLRIVDDEYKNYAEDYSVSEFQSTDAIEYFTTSETQAAPAEQINIQEDSGFAQSSDRSEALRDGQNFNNNNNTQSNTDSGSSSSSSNTSASEGGGSSSSGGSASSGSSSGANVTGGEATTATAGSSAAGASAGAGAGATAATAGTATAATIAGSVTVVAAAICAIVAVTANIIKMAPTIIMSYFMAGTNYIQYVLDVSDLDDEVDYIVSLSNPNFSYTYDLREDLTEDGKVEGLISGLKPHRSYKLQVLSVDTLGNVPHFTHEFITESEPKPEAVPRVEEVIDYDAKTFNLDYNIFISDAFHTGSNTFVEFYINDTLSSTDTNIDKDGYIIGQLQNLPNNSTVKGIIKTTYEEEVIEIGDFEYKVVYPSELNVNTKPLATSNTQSNIDYVNNKFNLNYSIQISDAYNTGSNTCVEFYINDELLTTDANINSDGYITGTLTNLPNEVKVVGVVKTTYEGEVIEIDNFEYDVLYPKEIITEDLAFKATFASEPEVETSLGTSADCYQYVYVINTGFNNAAQTTDKYLLEVVGKDDVVLDSYTGTSAMVSCAVDYDVEEAYVYLTPISVVYDEDMSFERRLVKTITNQPFVEYAGFVMRPGKDFIFTTKMSPLIMQESLICSYAKADESVVETSLEDGMVEVYGNSETQTAMVFQIIDSTGRIAGRKIIDLTQTSSFEVSFHTNGDYNLTEGYTIETTLDATPTFGEGEGYRLIVRDENDKFLGMGTTITDVLENPTLVIPDLTPTFYNAALACAKTVNGVEYIFENTANTDGCEHVFTPFEEGTLNFDAEYGSINHGLSVGSIYSTDDINITSTVTNTYLSGETTSFSFDIQAGLVENSQSETITSEQWNNLVKTEIVITNDAGTITYGRYVYQKSTTLLSVSNYGAKNRQVLITASVLDCPEDGFVNYVAFNKTDLIGSTTCQAEQDGDNWVVKVDSLSSVTLAGTWEYSFSVGDLEIMVSNYVSTSEDLDVTPYFDYYLFNQYGGADHQVFVRGYPQMDGEEVPLADWKLSIYNSDEGTPTAITSESGYDYIATETIVTEDGVTTFTCNAESEYIVYTMTYGTSETPLFSGFSQRYPLPLMGYNYYDLYTDAVSISMYEPSNFLTYNISEIKEVESINIYNGFTIGTTDTDIYYETYFGYNTGEIDSLMGAPIFQPYVATITRDHPYMAFEDVPYNSSYNLYTNAFKNIEMTDGNTYKVFLGQISIWGSLVCGVRSDGHSATHAVTGGPSINGGLSDTITITLDTINLNYLADGESVEFVIGDLETIKLDPSIVRDYSYGNTYEPDEPIVSDTIGTYTYQIINTKNSDINELSARIILSLPNETEISSAVKKMRVKNKIWSGADYMQSEFNVTMKGISLVNLDEPYNAIYDSNGNSITGESYFVGLDTVNAYMPVEGEIIITEFNI